MCKSEDNLSVVGSVESIVSRYTEKKSHGT